MNNLELDGRSALFNYAVDSNITIPVLKNKERRIDLVQQFFLLSRYKALIKRDVSNRTSSQDFNFWNMEKAKGTE